MSLSSKAQEHEGQRTRFAELAPFIFWRRIGRPLSRTISLIEWSTQLGCFYTLHVAMKDLFVLLRSVLPKVHCGFLSCTQEHESRRSRTSSVQRMLKVTYPGIISNLFASLCRDVYGNPYNSGDKSFAVTTAGPAPLQCSVAGTNVSSEFQATCTASLVGTYQVTVADSVDASAVVPGSPFQVSLKAADDRRHSFARGPIKAPIIVRSNLAEGRSGSQPLTWSATMPTLLIH